MPAFLEKKLKKRYGAKSKVPYKIMNAMGAMRGNKETAKGKAMAKKHARDKKRGGKKLKTAHKKYNYGNKKQSLVSRALKGAGRSMTLAEKSAARGDIGHRGGRYTMPMQAGPSMKGKNTRGKKKGNPY